MDDQFSDLRERLTANRAAHQWPTLYIVDPVDEGHARRKAIGSFLDLFDSESPYIAPSPSWWTRPKTEMARIVSRLQEELRIIDNRAKHDHRSLSVENGRVWTNLEANLGVVSWYEDCERPRSCLLIYA